MKITFSIGLLVSFSVAFNTAALKTASAQIPETSESAAKLAAPGAGTTHEMDVSAKKGAPEPVMGAIMELKIPKGAKVFFLNLKNGQKVAKDKDFVVKFGLKGMSVKPAGELTPNTGHHHLVIDGPAIEKGLPVPFDDHHQHFGKGQSEATIKLPAGRHTLLLQFANGAHLSYGPGLSAKIEVIAE